MTGFYLAMRCRQFLRFFSFNGINPVIGVTLSAIVFLGISEVLFLKMPYAGLFYGVFALLSLVQLQSANSNAFLLQQTSRKVFFKLKVAENMLLAIPFVAELLFHRYYLLSACLFLVIIPYSWFSYSLPKPKRAVLSTPYAKHSFEFQSGFRTYILIYPLHILLLVASVLSINIYVLLAAYFILLFFMSTFYGKVESEEFIWVYRTTAGGFLAKKAFTLFKHYCITFLPSLILGATLFTTQLPVLLLCMITGLLGLVGCIFIKYHFYPSEFVIQLSQMILLGLALFCMLNPVYVLLLIIILLFSFFKAMARLKTILQC